ncbi:B- and T-lymphocyte attenuator-like isoform X2 [Betta splendens]|uniref:B- and T-lymphocyte attenuator-like isoform X2 n=1 Tax=Betta splendens TaxID=158456 RepID=A0A6P7KZT5_BETSP|nr:B- and T-lymphocyte attenuator-like isoform X2 [Betta splendens]
MTGAILSTSIMKPHHCWLVLHVSILAALPLPLNADGEDSKCETELKVWRHTVYEASVGQELTINCPLTFCNNSPPTVFWHKQGETAVSAPINVSSDNHIKTTWRITSKNEGISSLVFKHIVSSDSGQYRCHSEGSVSHGINVSVYENGELPTAAWNDGMYVWMYVYFSAGIAVFVIIVIIISVISMRGCKGKSKQKTHTDNQYMEIPMLERPSSQASPRGSPLAPLPRRSTRRKSQEDQPSGLTTPRDNRHVYSHNREDGQRQVTVEGEEQASVVYAALNHQLPPGTAARPPRLHVEEACSEYAAIRVS